MVVWGRALPFAHVVNARESCHVLARTLESTELLELSVSLIINYRL